MAELLLSARPTELIDALRPLTGSHPFARAMVARYDNGDALSDPQWRSVQRMVDTFSKPAQLTLVPKFKDAEPAAPAARSDANRYPALCEVCNHMVAANAGRRARATAGSGWVVFHLDGECVITPEEELAELLSRLDHVQGERFGLPCIDGRNDFDYVLFTEKRDGTRVVKRFMGGAGWIEQSVERQITWAEQIEALDAEALEAAGMRFADDIHACRDCGRPLEKEASRLTGRGPKCSQKGDR